MTLLATIARFETHRSPCSGCREPALGISKALAQSHTVIACAQLLQSDGCSARDLNTACRNSEAQDTAIEVEAPFSEMRTPLSQPVQLLVALRRWGTCTRRRFKEAKQAELVPTSS